MNNATDELPDIPICPRHHKLPQRQGTETCSLCETSDVETFVCEICEAHVCYECLSQEEIPNVCRPCASALKN